MCNQLFSGYMHKREGASELVVGMSIQKDWQGKLPQFIISLVISVDVI